PVRRIEYKPVNIEKLQEIAEMEKISKIDPDVLVKAGIVSSKKHLIKILGKGSLTAKLEVEAHAFSKSAAEAIKSAGGTVIKLQ
ncbi:MAG: uL15 family ribosomal protein, partial [Dysgonamonadaceae bacterium]|nr:uL15 family ribosomal protein [Dysgonamonadaceae bacterium]